KKPAWGTSANTYKGSSRNTLPSSDSVTLPTWSPAESGAISGWVYWATGLMSDPLPRGTVTHMGVLEPSPTVSASPSQTRAVTAGLSLSYSLMVSKFWKLQFSSFRLFSVRAASLAAPTITDTTRRPSRKAVVTRQ